MTRLNLQAWARREIQDLVLRRLGTSGPTRSSIESAQRGQASEWRRSHAAQLPPLPNRQSLGVAGVLGKRKSGCCEGFMRPSSVAVGLDASDIRGHETMIHSAAQGAELPVSLSETTRFSSSEPWLQQGHFELPPAHRAICSPQNISTAQLLSPDGRCSLSTPSHFATHLCRIAYSSHCEGKPMSTSTA